jgi:hypothetical protein
MEPISTRYCNRLKGVYLVYVTGMDLPAREFYVLAARISRGSAFHVVMLSIR